MMLSRSVFTLSAVLVLAMCTQSALCEPDGMPSVGYLANAGQLIVVGNLRPDSLHTARLTIDHVIKGTMVAGSVYSVELRQCPGAPGEVSDTTNEYGVWFLDQQSDHSLAFSASPKVQSCPFVMPIINPPNAPPPVEWRYGTALAVADKLAFELAYALVSNPPAAVPIWTINPDAFHGATPETRHKIMTTLSANPSADLHDIGMLGLVESGDVNAIRELHARVNRGNQPATTSAPSKPLPLMDALAISHIFSADPSTIASLGDIASDRNAVLAVRQSAAEVLRNIHTPQATSILAPLMDDPDSNIREDAVAAIACLANGVPPIDMHNGKSGIDLGRDVPTKTTATLNHFAFGHETISTQEAYYIAYWRQWWQSNAASLLSSSSSN
jgi:hypothetical protein